MGALRSYFNLLGVGWVLAREGVINALPSEGLPAYARLVKAMLVPFARPGARRQARSDRLGKAISRLGPS